MAFSITSRTPVSFGSKQGVALLINISSYATGGEVITPAALGMESGAVPYIVNVIPANAMTPYVFTHDRTNNKLLAYDMAGTEITATTAIGACELIVLQQ